MPAIRRFGSMWNGDTANRVVGVRTLGDDLLAAIAPLGLALAAGTALMVDLDVDGPPYPGDRTVAELVQEGPRRAELSPDRNGVATLRNGGADTGAAIEVVATLAGAWPTIVARVGAEAVPFPVIPVRPLWPGFLAPRGERPAVWQTVPGGSDPPGPGPVLPPPGRATVSALLVGRRPLRSRWLRAWAKVWELPWQ